MLRRATAVLTTLAGIVSFSAAVPTPATARAATAAGPGMFTTTVSPARLLDTRTGLGATRAGAVAARGTVSVSVTGRGGVPAQGVGSVAVRVTATADRASGYVTAFPHGAGRPAASVVNHAAGRTASNATIVPVGTGGRVDLYNGSSGTAHLVLDVTGWFASGTGTAPGSLQPLTSSRVLDTRTAGHTALAARGSLTVRIAATHGVPATGAGAAVLNVTATGSAGGGYLTAYPAGAPRPATSSLNFTAGATVANLAVATLGSGGAVTVYNGSTRPVQLVVDVDGWFRAGPVLDAGGFVPRIPARALDTRDHTAGLSIGPADSITVGLAVTPASSARMTAAVVNLTVPANPGSGYLSAYPSGAARPAASSLNFTAGTASAAAGLVRVGDGAQLTIYNGSHQVVDVVVDLLGFFGDGSQGAISGTVDSSAGQAVPHAVVHVGYASPTPQYSQTDTIVTDDAGRYVVSGVDPGDFDVCFGGHAAVTGDAPYGYSDQCWNARPRYDPDPVTVQAARVTTGVDAHLPAAAELRGRITDHDGNGLAGVRVQLNQDPEPVSAVTSAGGVYRLDGVDDGGAGLDLCAHDPGAATGGVGEAGYLDSCTTATSTQVRGGQAVIVDDLALDAAAGVSGTVTDASGRPLAGVPVYLSRSETQGFFVGAPLGFSDAEGHYAIYGQRALDFDVCYQGSAVAPAPVDGYADSCYHDVPIGSGVVPTGLHALTLTAGRLTTGIDQTVQANGAISGTVRDPAGKPLPGVLVQASPADGAYRSATTTSTGTYVIHNLPVGPFEVCGYAPYNLSTSAAPYGLLRSCVHPTVSGAATSTGSITMGAAGAVRGLVTDTAGNPLHDVAVDADNNGVGQVSDDRGEYLITNMQPGTNTVCAYPDRTGYDGPHGGTSTFGYVSSCYDGKPTKDSATPVTIKAGAVTTVDLVLPSAGAISGRVTDESGAPLGSISVAITAGSTSFGAYTRSDGTYSQAGIAPGDYTVCFRDTTFDAHADRCYHDVVPPAQGTPVAVTAGQVTDGVDQVLPPR